MLKKGKKYFFPRKAKGLREEVFINWLLENFLAKSIYKITFLPTQQFSNAFLLRNVQNNLCSLKSI
jgi:hypothetical protein